VSETANNPSESVSVATVDEAWVYAHERAKEIYGYRALDFTCYERGAALIQALELAVLTPSSDLKAIVDEHLARD
jgi:hypothetical protein